MPVPSSSFDTVTPLPPRVVAIRHALFQAPDETGLSVSVPTTYKLFTSETAPSSDKGENGDWYIWVTAASIKTYRKVIGVWTLVSTIAGGTGGGGGGGDLSGITLTDCIFTNGEINGSTILTSSLLAPTITGGTIASPVITSPVITAGTITSTVITGLPPPVLPTDAATKGYVDGVAQGFQPHDPCKAATVGANISLTGGAPNTLDGVTLALNDRILVKNQTNPIQNGIYTVTTLGTGSNGTWSRATDADTGNELDRAYVLVTNGTSNGGTSWVVSGSPVIGTDPVLWIIFFTISSIPAGNITGTINADQIGSVNASVINGLINASQIGSINAGQINGTITSTQIGSVNASAIIGSINSTQIGSVSATSIAGTISATQIGSVNANSITGVIVTNQLADQILNTQRLIANDLSVVRRVATLPTLPNADYPAGALALNTTNKTLYQNVSGSWQVVTASSNVVGTLTANDIASINASSIVGLIIASQISSVNATSLIGGINASQINSVNATAIAGTITSSQISSVSATAITGSISASQIGSVNASAITGTIDASHIGNIQASSIVGLIQATQIASVNANTITVGSLNSINYSIGSGANQTTITPSGLTVGFLTINGSSNQNSINIGSSLSFPVFITGGSAAASLRLGQSSVSGSITMSAGTINQIRVVDYGIVGRNSSGRFAIEALSGNSISFTTSSTERWIVGSDGHLKTLGGYITKVSSDGWGPKMHDGSHTYEFRWSGGLQVRIDGSTVLNVVTS